MEKSLKKGTKIVLEQTGQIGRIVNWDYSITHAQVEIVTPTGPRILIILKTLIQVVEIIDGLWPVLKLLWETIFGKKKKPIVISDGTRIP